MVKLERSNEKVSSSSHNPKGITLLTKAQLGFRHLFGGKFNHGFQGKFLGKFQGKSFNILIRLMMMILMMMMMMMMMMNCFFGMVDRRKALNFISSQDHCQRSSPSRILDTLRAGLEPAQNLSSGFVETAWKVSKYGVFSGPHFPVFRLNTEIY